MAAQDFFWNGTDLTIVDGDFKVDLSDPQHIELLLLAGPGQLRHDPLQGVGLARAKGGPLNAQALRRDIRQKLEADNYRIIQIAVDRNTQAVRVNAERQR